MGKFEEIKRLYMLNNTCSPCLACLTAILVRVLHLMALLSIGELLFSHKGLERGRLRPHCHLQFEPCVQIKKKVISENAIIS